MRIIRRVVVGLVLVIVVSAVLAILGTVVPDPLFPGAADTAPKVKRILVVSNPIHTDIAIPIDEESLAALDFLIGTGPPVTHPEARWMLIGWGGRSFYLETPSFADIKPGPTFKALTLDSSVMHVDVLPELVLPDPIIMPLDLSADAYGQLLAAISASFTRKDGGILPIDGYKLGQNDRFYEGEGLFNALIGCNTWTARMLRTAGLRTGWWNPLPVSLTTSLRLFNEVPA